MDAEKTNDTFSWDSCQVDTTSEDLDGVDVAATVVDLPNAPRVRVASVSRKNANDKPAEPASHDDLDEDDELENIVVPQEIGILALRNVTVFPGTVMPLAVGRPRSRRLLRAALQSKSLIGTLTQKNPQTDQPVYDDLHTVGTAVTVLKLLKVPDGPNSLVVHGLIRFRVVEWLADQPYLRARIEVLESTSTPGKNLDAMVNHIRQMAMKMVELSPNIPDEVGVVIHNIEDAGMLADFLSANINIDLEKKQELLEELNVNERLGKLSLMLAEQVELLEMSAKIQKRVSKNIDKTQREYYLQEQLKAIQSELGQDDQRAGEINELRQMIQKADMPEPVEKEALRELDRLARIPNISPEFAVIRSYIEWLCELPWNSVTTDKLSLTAARRVLNTDHHGLTTIKKRILEFLAVRKLNPEGRSPILCFAGPPGVGKTSLGRSIARSMGREFIRISLGGIRDEADIRGHRRTYIGSMPGRVIQELRKCGTRNPVFMLDELDKIGQDFRGDPASALLEVLDPEQNNTFTDHYIDQPFDLSKVMFIGTANYMGNVPEPLRDRMEVIELPGYTAGEKLAIAEKYLLPRQRSENGLTERTITVKTEAMERMIRNYTREAGVRELERKIAAVCRHVASEIADNKRKSATINARALPKILGKKHYESELALRTSTPGVATGLAYTPVGGEILFIEATRMPGTGQLVLTGQLGEVMKESAQAAWSVLKSLAVMPHHGKLEADLAKIVADEKLITKQDLHIHVPAGAVPKDGPSAGLAIYTALVSLLTNRCVRGDVAMTGEITLRGLAMPIGGVKEKVLAARAAGIKTVILPERNRDDLEDLPAAARKGLTFEFVRDVRGVLRVALCAEKSKGQKK